MFLFPVLWSRNRNRRNPNFFCLSWTETVTGMHYGSGSGSGSGTGFGYRSNIKCNFKKINQKWKAKFLENKLLLTQKRQDFVKFLVFGILINTVRIRKSEPDPPQSITVPQHCLFQVKWSSILLRVRTNNTGSSSAASRNTISNNTGTLTLHGVVQIVLLLFRYLKCAICKVKLRFSQRSLVGHLQVGHTGSSMPSLFSCPTWISPLFWPPVNASTMIMTIVTKVRHATSSSCCAEKPQSAAEQIRGTLWLSRVGNISAVSQAEARYATKLLVE